MHRLACVVIGVLLACAAAYALDKGDPAPKLVVSPLNLEADEYDVLGENDGTALLLFCRPEALGDEALIELLSAIEAAKKEAGHETAAVVVAVVVDDLADAEAAMALCEEHGIEAIVVGMVAGEDESLAKWGLPDEYEVCTYLLVEGKVDEQFDTLEALVKAFAEHAEG